MENVKGMQVAHALRKPDPVYPDGYQTVAIVEWREDLTEMENLEMAFRLTNHIDRPWWENPGVTVAGPVPFKHRSTSVGDVVAIPDGTVFRITFDGWKAISDEIP